MFIDNNTILFITVMMIDKKKKPLKMLLTKYYQTKWLIWNYHVIKCILLLVFGYYSTQEALSHKLQTKRFMEAVRILTQFSITT